MKRPTEMYPRAWIAHHQLQYGMNWRYVRSRYFPTKEKPMNNGG